MFVPLGRQAVPAHIGAQLTPMISESASTQETAAPQLLCKLPILIILIQILVGLGGVEPPTRSLGNCCSIHLSYSPTNTKFITSLQPLAACYKSAHRQ